MLPVDFKTNPLWRYYFYVFCSRIALTMIGGLFVLIFLIPIHTEYNKIIRFKQLPSISKIIKGRSYTLPTYESNLIGPIKVLLPYQKLKFKLQHDEPESVTEFMPMNAYFFIYKDNDLLLTQKLFLKNQGYETSNTIFKKKYCNLCATSFLTFSQPGNYFFKAKIIASKPVNFPLRIKIQEVLGSVLLLFPYNLLLFSMAIVNYMKLEKLTGNPPENKIPSYRYAILSTMIMTIILMTLLVVNCKGWGNLGYDGLYPPKSGSYKSYFYGQYWYGKQGINAPQNNIDKRVLKEAK